MKKLTLESQLVKWDDQRIYKLVCLHTTEEDLKYELFGRSIGGKKSKLQSIVLLLAIFRIKFFLNQMQASYSKYVVQSLTNILPILYFLHHMSINMEECIMCAKYAIRGC